MPDAPLFRVKICGITNASDAVAAVEAGADALGLNFYPQSPRCISIATAQEIQRRIETRACRVGVFVNAALEEVASIAVGTDLDAIQFHGDEPPEYLVRFHLLNERCQTLPIIRAFRCRDADYRPFAQYVEQVIALGGRLDAALIDAHVQGKYGGGGAAIDWNAFRQAKPLFPGLPLILAGGLNADNVDGAILAAEPAAVDVASGVEVELGKKDGEAVRRFVANAERGFARIGKGTE